MVDLPCLNCCLLDYTTGKLRSVVMKILKIVRFQNKIFLLTTLQNNIYRSNEESPTLQSFS